jgi:hypothetical protein
MQVATLNWATYMGEMELHILGKSIFQVPEIPRNNFNTQKIILPRSSMLKISKNKIKCLRMYMEVTY